jgi:transposase
VIRSRLRQHGYRVRSGGAEAFTARVRALPLPGRLLSEGGPLPAVMRQVNQPLADTDERIEALTTTDSRVRLLRTVPSGGTVTAAAFVAAWDEVTRFRGAHQVEAYGGLVPRERSSGERRRRGGITKAGPSRGRRLLGQAAVSIRRLRDPRPADLRGWALAIAARRGKKVAVVAVARRLAGILYAMLRDRTRYEPRRPTRSPRTAASTPVPTER